MTAQRTPGERGQYRPNPAYAYDAQRHQDYRRRNALRLGGMAKPVLDPEGRRFDSLGAAAAAYGLTRAAVGYRARVRTGGWRFADDAS